MTGVGFNRQRRGWILTFTGNKELRRDITVCETEIAIADASQPRHQRRLGPTLYRAGPGIRRASKTTSHSHSVLLGSLPNREVANRIRGGQEKINNPSGTVTRALVGALTMQKSFEGPARRARGGAYVADEPFLPVGRGNLAGPHARKSNTGCAMAPCHSA